ncbi:hypothetical protein GN958_ATG02704 [Phytophthora infestans]|uniref:Uncharacterized protein n=1 Tax=Phytophthora infestans TaxID=4787 RepID=A0A8S9V7K4_PHYIN|nr:hypothetical protein GN958_ATG02704 [Phytophthora infestans]
MASKKSVVAQMVGEFPFEATDMDFVRAFRAGSLANNKEGFIELLRSYRQQRRSEDAAVMAGPHKTFTRAAEERATKHCRFRLASFVFGDSLIECMGEMDGIPGRGSVGLGAVNASGQYWHGVASKFCGATPRYDNLIKSQEEYEGIWPAGTPQLSSTKLMKLWQEIRSLYRTAKSRFTRSGTNEVSFVSF